MKLINGIFIGTIYLLVNVFICSCSKSPISVDSQSTLNSAEYKQYESEVVSLKQTAKSTEEFNNGYNVVKNKFKNILSTQFGQKTIENPMPYVKSYQPKNDGVLPSFNLGNNSSLSKQTSLTIEPVLTKEYSTEIKRPFFMLWKPYNASGARLRLVADVIATSPGVDPFVVIYSIGNGSFTDNRLLQNLNIRGWNDDYNGSLNSRVDCLTGPTAENVILAFSYNGISGSAKLILYSGLCSPNTLQAYTSRVDTFNITVAGTPIFGDNNGYILKDGQAVSSVPSGWAPYVANGATFVTDNLSWGSINWGAYTPSCTGDSYIWAFNFSTMEGTANDDYYGYGSACCLDPYQNGSFPSGSWHYPNVVLLGGYSDGGTMNMVQMIGYKH